MPEPEYCDLVCVLLLRTLSAFTALYPGNPQLRSGVSAWQNNLDEMDELTKTSLYWWPEYCLRVTSPTRDLIRGLNAFDPYAVAAMLLVRIRDVSGRLQKWEECLERVKSLDNLVPRRFVQKLEAFLRGFDVSIPSNISQPSRRTFSPKDRDFGDTLGEFIWRASQESTSSTKPFPMVFPIAKKRPDMARSSDNTTETDDVVKRPHSGQPFVENKDTNVHPGVDHPRPQASGPSSDPHNTNAGNATSPLDSGEGQATQGNDESRRKVNTGLANELSSQSSISETNARGSRPVVPGQDSIRAALQGNHIHLEEQQGTPTTHSSTGSVFNTSEGHTIELPKTPNATAAYTPLSSQASINDEVKGCSTRGGTHGTSPPSTSESPAQQPKIQDDVLNNSSSTQARTALNESRGINNAGPSASPSSPGVSDPASQPLSAPARPSNKSHLPGTNSQGEKTSGDQQSKDGFCAWLKRLFCCC
ncbi:hypothetical protein VNI00_005952 [Paramarasmius palmivorus]|uniref:Uncharacterized protein n=1 Tax=Paramarasmius palmivorus TaxID=297713 RepID=A0AAW0DGW9_9AGAR